MSHIANAAGCDSAITTTLTVIPNSSSSASVSICQGFDHTLPDGTSQVLPEFMFRTFQMRLDVIARSPTLTVIPNKFFLVIFRFAKVQHIRCQMDHSQNTTGVYVSHIGNAARLR